jgi:polar amino acid transport system substrate-binding protein
MLNLITRIIAILAMSATLSTPVFAEQLQSILARGEVAIGVPENFPPFGSVGKDFNHEGYDVDVAGLIAKDLGVKLKVVPLTSKQRIPFLSSGKVDLVISSMGANPKRAKSIWFSSAYAPFFSGAYARQGVNVSNYVDLKNYKVGVTGGTLEDLTLTEKAPNGTDIVRFGDNAANISAFVAGQTDVLITGNIVAAKVISENPGKKIEPKFIMRESPCFIGVRQGETNMLQWVNVFILHKTLGGDLNELSMKWFGQPLPPLPSL